MCGREEYSNGPRRAWVASVLSAHISSTRLPRAALTGLLAAAALFVAGCGADADGRAAATAEPTVAIAALDSTPAAPESASTSTPSPTATPAPAPATAPASTEPDPPVNAGGLPPLTEVAVLDAHAAYLSAFHDSMNPPNPHHPGLAAWATGPQLETARTIRTTQVERNWQAQGTYASSPSVSAISETEATVLDCYEEDITVLDARGLVVQRVEPGTYILESVLVPENGVWKVSLFLSEKTPCTVG